jgi:ribosomal 50S subunit-associated protein YjgA (DUF615 family)
LNKERLKAIVDVQKTLRDIGSEMATLALHLECIQMMVDEIRGGEEESSECMHSLEEWRVTEAAVQHLTEASASLGELIKVLEGGARLAIDSLGAASRD